MNKGITNGQTSFEVLWDIYFMDLAAVTEFIHYVLDGKVSLVVFEGILIEYYFGIVIPSIFDQCLNIAAHKSQLIELKL